MRIDGGGRAPDDAVSHLHEGRGNFFDAIHGYITVQLLDCMPDGIPGRPATSYAASMRRLKHLVGMRMRRALIPIGVGLIVCYGRGRDAHLT